MNFPRFPALDRVPLGTGGLVDDFYFFRGEYTDFVFVFFNGSIPPKIGLGETHYQRWSWFQSLNRPSISLPDPSTGKSTGLRLAWYVGTQQQPLLHDLLSNVLSHIRALYPKSRVIAVGSSGGGFAAAMSNVIGLTNRAIVFNPQVNILNYRKSPVDSFLKYYGRAREQIDQSDLYRLSLAHEIERSHDYVNIDYFQNTEDLHHFTRHHLSMRRSIKGLPNTVSSRVRFSYFSDEKLGHDPPPRDMMLKMIGSALWI